jgi:hypothetical protein
MTKIQLEQQIKEQREEMALMLEWLEALTWPETYDDGAGYCDCDRVIDLTRKFIQEIPGWRSGQGSGTGGVSFESEISNKLRIRVTPKQLELFNNLEQKKLSNPKRGNQ